MRGWRVVAGGVADATGVAGTSGLRLPWAQLGIDPWGRRLPWSRLFERPFPEFRRLDPLSRFCCLAAEAAGLEALPDRTRTAVVLVSTLGCLHADLRFQASLAPGAELEPAVFPYTLPSTCLGDLAIRHALKGPTLSLTVAPGQEAEGVAEAGRLLELDEAAAALVCAGDVLPHGGPDLPACLSITALVLVPGEPRPQDLDGVPRAVGARLWGEV